MKKDNWDYSKGKFYISFGGNAITYIEINPCGCCPNTALQVSKFNSRPSKTFATLGFYDLKKELPKYLKRFNFVELE